MPKKNVAMLTMHIAIELDAEMPDSAGINPETIQAALASATEAATKMHGIAAQVLALPGVLHACAHPDGIAARAEFESWLAEGGDGADDPAQLDLAKLATVGGVQ